MASGTRPRHMDNGSHSLDFPTRFDTIEGTRVYEAFNMVAMVLYAVGPLPADTRGILGDSRAEFDMIL